MGYHDWFKSGDVNVRSNMSGTFINVENAGTAAFYDAGNYEYHAAVFVGTLGNVGTLFVYAAKDASATGKAALGSVIAGSSNGLVAFEFKTDVLTNLGTDFTHWTAGVKVENGGTWAGGLLLLDHGARTKGTTSAAVGVATLRQILA
jgi:hypothetical protein